MRIALSLLILWGVSSCTNPKESEIQKLVWHQAVTDYVHQSTIDPVFRAADSLKYLGYYDSALKAFSGLSEQPGLGVEQQAYCWNQIAYLYLLLHKDTLAQTWSDRLLNQHGGHLDALSPGAQADWYYNAGLAAMRLFKPKQARQCLEKAIALYDSLYADGPHLRRALAYTQLSMVAYNFEKDTPDVFRLADKAYEMIHQDAALWQHSLEVEATMMYVSRWRKNHAEVMAHSHNVLYLAQRLPHPDSLAMAYAYAMQSRIHLFDGTYEKARQCIFQSLALSKGISGVHYPYFLRNKLFYYAYTKQKDSLDLEMAEFEKRPLQQPDHYIYPDRIYGFYYERIEPDKDKAFNYYKKHLKKHEWDTLAQIEIREAPYRVLAQMYANKKQYDSAVHYIGQMFFYEETQASKQLTTEADILKPATYKKVLFPFWMLQKLGAVLLDRYKRDEPKPKHLLNALKAFRLGDSLLFAQNAAYDEVRISFYQEEMADALYGNAVEVLYLLDSLYPQGAKYSRMATHYIDRMKSDFLFKSLPDNLPVDSIRAMKYRIDSMVNLKDRLPLYSNRELAFNLHKLGQIQTSNYNDEKKNGNKQTVSTQLSPIQAVLQYKVRENQIYILYTDQKRCKLHRSVLPKGIKARQLTDSLRLLQNRPLPNTELSLSHYLYQQLVAPFQEDLRQRPAWIIIPDDVLYELPFEALVARQDANKPCFLVEEDSIRSFTYSLAWKIWQRSNRTATQVSPSKVHFFNYGKDKNHGLIYADGEYKALQERFKEVVQPNFDKACTKQNFIQVWNRAEANSIVHVVLHGLTKKSRFTPKFATNLLCFGGPQDSLYDFEIARLKNLNINLVLLSACETHAGTVSPGEGVHSMARSFIQAGAGSVIASLWKLDHAAHTKQITYFYKDVGHVSKALALSNAKRTYLKMTKQHKMFSRPHYWAAPIYLE